MIVKETHDEFGHEIVLRGTVHQIRVFDTGQAAFPLMVEVFGLGGEVTALMEPEDIEGLREFLGKVK